MAKPRTPKPVAKPKSHTKPETPKVEQLVEPVDTDEEEEESDASWFPKFCSKCSLKIILLAIVCGALNAWNGYTLFENDTYFSHLSNLEREMTFRTEMGLYYSYYKNFIMAPTVVDGFKGLIENNQTEFPTTINTLKRFNLYPELVIGVAYRMFQVTVEYFNIDSKNCFTIARGDLPSVESCAGIGDHAIFYMTCVYIWNALTGIALVGICFLISESFFGTCICILLYFANFLESTRIQWTPPLRESFAYPLILMQIFLTTLYIRSYLNSKSCLVYVMVTTGCLICWQFSQFALLTQICSLFFVFTYHNAIEPFQMQYFACMHLCSIFIAYVMLLMNDMLFTSFYSAAVIASIVVSGVKVLNRMKYSYAKCFVQLLSFVVITVTIKITMGMFIPVTDDGHIWSILRAKISDYKDFHTMLYTCAPEFDFLKIDYFWAIYDTIGVVLVAAILGAIYYYYWKFRDFNTETLYNFYQGVCFLYMALTIMRLKMFLTPHLCILSSLALGFKNDIPRKVRMAIGVALLAIILVPVYGKLSKQHSFTGENSNPNLEELLTFIDDYAEPNDSFAGPMPLMANILLSTNRPIVNHPHYENEELRRKTVLIYQLLSRKELSEVHKDLKNLSVNLVVVQRAWCFGKMRTGCALVDIWDTIDPANKSKRQICEKLINEETENLFEVVFKNEEYTMLRLL